MIIVGGKVFEGFTQTCLSNGAKPGARVIKCELVPSSEAESKCLKLSEGAVLLHIQRVRTANEWTEYKNIPGVEFSGIPALQESLYREQGFPTKIVIGPDGKIVKTIVGEDPAFYTLLDEVLK